MKPKRKDPAMWLAAAAGYILILAALGALARWLAGGQQ